jgi:glyoxylase-like metal-dependent hydrolase (beta-lactamase superfamily II)
MLHPHPVKDVTDDFPLLLEDNVFYTGFNSPKSFGGNSYFIWHPDGNWLIDSPKYLPHLVQAFSSLGGIRYIFLTHRDDVADAEKYAKKFGGKRIIHRLELPSQPDAEIVIDGREPNQLSPEFLAVPTPGHTRGHCVLLHKGRFLFTGDHLWWSRPKNRLHASEAVCWYSWDEQCVSMHRLKRYGFEWVLPGHGQRIRLSREAMQQQLAGLVDRMENRSHTFVNRNKVAETQ